MMSGLKRRLNLLDVTMEITDSAMDLIIEKGYDETYGARPLKKVIQRHIEDKLSAEILKGNLPEKSVITVDALDGVFTFNKKD